MNAAAIYIFLQMQDSLTMKESVSFLGINIIYLPDRRIYVSQPGAIVKNYDIDSGNLTRTTSRES